MEIPWRYKPDIEFAEILFLHEVSFGGDLHPSLQIVLPGVRRPRPVERSPLPLTFAQGPFLST